MRREAGQRVRHFGAAFRALVSERAVRWLDAAMLSCVTAGDLLLLLALQCGSIDRASAIFARLAIAVWGVWACRRLGMSRTWLFVSLVGGPVGTLLVGLRRLAGTLAPIDFDAVERAATPEDVRRQQGGDISRAQIVAGRAFQPGQTSFKRFGAIARSGQIEEKRALLGLICLKYHPGFLPLLMQLLRAPEASVRAQAAAVFVKLRASFRARLATAHAAAAARPLDPATARALSAEILACVGSGFVAEADAAAARSLALELSDLALAADGATVSDAEHAFVRGRLLAAASRHDDAARQFGAVSDRHGGAERLFAESLMALRRYADLARLLAVRTVPDDRVASAEALRRWS
jgi:hypothetical protein